MTFLVSMHNIRFYHQVFVIDSKSLHDTRYLNTDVRSIQQSLQKQECAIWVYSYDQLADCLTKKGKSYERFYDAMSGKIKLIN